MTEPRLGWRIWRLEGGVLHSPAARYSWRPGENTASCLAEESVRCSSSPGSGCKCGFWAVNEPRNLPNFGAGWAILQAMGKVRGDLVVGLTRGFGTVALHGTEGFRAELAVIACIFSNRVKTDLLVADEVRVEVPHRRPLRSRLSRRRDQLQAVGDAYAVPCLPIESALSIGLLQELGMDRYAVQNVRNWLEDMRHGPPPKDKPRPPTLRLRPA